MTHTGAIVTVLCAVLLLVSCKTSIILDTDIGSYTDDTWALGLLLASPEVQIELIVVSTLNTTQRAQVLAQFLTQVGRADIPIAIGPNQGGDIGGQYPYGKTFDLSTYPGQIFTDAPQAIIDTVTNQPDITILELSPPTTLAIALSEHPELFVNSRVVTMNGCIYLPEQEYNAAFNATATQIMYQQQYASPMITAPLDTSQSIGIWGSYYQQLVDAQFENVLVWNILEAFRVWAGHAVLMHSAILFDAEAARLLYSLDDVNIELLPISVNATGYTVIDPEHGSNVYAATSWQDQGRYGWQEDVTQRLLRWQYL